jgi:uncharacterized protein (DUF58 family)
MSSPAPRIAMITPVPIMVAAALVLTIIGGIAGFSGDFATLWKLLAGLVGGICLVDLLLCFARPRLSLTRTISHSLSVNGWTKVGLKLLNEDKRKLRIRLHDHHPGSWSVEGQPAEVAIGVGQCVTSEYRLCPDGRGDYSLEGSDCVVESPLRFWRRKWFVDCRDMVKVFPNFREISHYTLLATSHRLSLLGIKKQIRRGEGKEFHQLREYRQGDELQRIDWKATSRMRKLITKDYQDERDQQVVFVLDSGRRMGHAESGRKHLDQALSSVLLLAYVASRQGDAVGFYCFGSTWKWHPPQKKSDPLRSLLLTSYNVQSSAATSDYLKATSELLTLQRRRALMVIITNSRSEDYDDIIQMARQLREKHLVVLADIRESILDETAGKKFSSLQGAQRYQALHCYLEQRASLFSQLSHIGVLPLDVTAEQLPVSIVNTYLEIKGAGRL